MSRFYKDTGNRTNPGDELASGGVSATFAVAPNKKFDEGQFRDDLTKLPAESFILKYMITQREYDIISTTTNEEKISTFAQDMKTRAEFYDRGIALDEAQEASLKRDCFILPYYEPTHTGRVICQRDDESKPKGAASKLIIPKSMKKEKTLLPTTGHVIKACVINLDGKNISDHYLGKRLLFGQMSGTAICFKGFPTWIQLELSEILAWVPREDVEIEEIPLEPLV